MSNEVGESEGTAHGAVLDEPPTRATSSSDEDPGIVSWRDRDGNEWLIKFNLALIDGRQQPREVTISAPEGAQGLWVTGSLLRALPFARLSERARQQDPVVVTVVSTMSPHPDISHAQLQVTRTRTPGRPRRYGHDFFTMIAQEYQEAALVTNAPTQKVADAHGVKRGAVQKWLRTSRKLGLLPPP